MPGSLDENEEAGLYIDLIPLNQVIRHNSLAVSLPDSTIPDQIRETK